MTTAEPCPRGTACPVGDRDRWWWCRSVDVCPVRRIEHAGLVAMIGTFVRDVPVLLPLLQEQLDTVEEILPTTFLGDVGRVGCEGGFTDAEWAAIVAWLDARAAAGNPWEINEIAVGFGEAMPFPHDDPTGLRDTLTPLLRELSW